MDKLLDFKLVLQMESKLVLMKELIWIHSLSILKDLYISSLMVHSMKYGRG